MDRRVIMRTRNTILSMLARLASSIIPSILGVILNNLILRKYGADTHGLTSTIAQIMSLLTIFESGYALAANVALYKPYVAGDWTKVSAILTAVKIIYLKIGKITAILSIAVALAAPLILKSELDYGIISILILISSVGTVTSFFIFSKYGIMFSAAQLEYKQAVLFLALNILSQILSILLVLGNQGIVVIRLVAALVPLVGTFIVIRIFHKDFPQVTFSSPSPDYSIVQSTKSVFAPKMASLIFSSTDMVVLSIAIGTLSTSVYSVYNIVFGFIKGILLSESVCGEIVSQFG